MSIASVTHSHVFGINATVRENVFYVDESTLLYSAGCNIIVTNSEQGTQKYVPVSSNGICAMTLSSDRHSFAVAEFGASADTVVKSGTANAGPQPTITVLDTQSCRKRRTVGASDGCASKEFVALSFSSDAKYLAAQGGGPDWLLHFYAWEKGKLLATLCTSSDIATSAPVTQVSINPLDETELCAISQGRACLYRYTEGSLRQVNFSGLPQLDYTCHAWLPPIPSRLALGTSAGEIVVLLNGEVIQTLHFGNNIQCIMGLARGFACGGSGGLVQIFERFTEDSPTKDMFKWIRSIPVPDESAVRNITGSASDGIIVIEVEACQLFSFALSEQKSTKGEEPKFHALSQPFHRGAISGLDTCVRKPILVTCGVDLSIRIWNYQQNTCELVKYFSEEPYSVALHPSGLYILVGFADKLRLMNVLMDDLRVFREFPLRGCRECRFSSGGHFFAAAQGNMFQIYSTWTFENVANLKGHNGRVRSLTWAYDDSYLVSSGADGAVYSWNVADMKRENEHILKSTAYSCAVVSRDGKSMWAVGSDKMLKEITESTVTVEIETDQPLTQIVLSNSGRMLFAGTTSGSIRAVKFPLSNRSDDYQEHAAHFGPVTRMRMSYDDTHLFTTSEDGAIFIFKVSDKEERGIRRERTAIYADEILVTRSDLEEKTIQTSELRRSLEELQIEHEYQLRLRDMTFNEKLKELTERFSGEMEALKISTSTLRMGKEKEEVKHEEALAQLVQKHGGELHEVEANYNQILMEEYEKYQGAQQDAQRLQETWQRQMRQTEEDTNKSMNDSQTEWEAKLQQKASEIEKLEGEMRIQLAEQTEEHNQMTQDIDSEIARLTGRYDRKLKAEREEGARLKGENGIMRKKFNTLTKDIEDQRSEMARLGEDEKKLRGVIEVLEKDVNDLKREMSERDTLIQEKERRVYDLKKKNQELEKFKFVLDFRIKELKEQVEPRETHIKEMTAQIAEISTALEVLTTHKEKHNLVIADLNTRLEQQQDSYRGYHTKAHQLSHYIRSFLTDIENAVQYIQETNVLQVSLRQMETKYLANTPRNSLVDAALEPEVAEQCASQEQVLRERIRKLRSMVEGNQKKFRTDSMDSISVNRGLIREINRLRQMSKLSNKGTGFQVIAIGEVSGRTSKQARSQNQSPIERSAVSPANALLNYLKLPSLVVTTHSDRSFE